MSRTQAIWRLALLIAAGAVASCGTMPAPFGGLRARADNSTLNRPAADAEAARSYLADLATMQAGPPSRQAEDLQAAKGAAETTPTTLNRLRYALMLGLPGHPGSDPVAARRQLSDLLARPELLLPTERSLASVLLADVSERLVLIAESRRLQEEASSHDKERMAAVTRRLQTEQEESARLRRALEDAQKKLNAITQLERSISGRGNPPKP
ncbi:MAG: hypothetical protein WCH32_13830 [Pseudomonadota bacterium]